MRIFQQQKFRSNILAFLFLTLSSGASGLSIDQTPLQKVRSGTQVFQASFNPLDSGNILVAAGRNVAQISYEPIQALWSIDSPNPYANMGAFYSPDGTMAAAGGFGTLVIYDVASGRELKRFVVGDESDFLDSVSFSSNHRLMFAGGMERNKVVVYSTDTWTKVQEFLCPENCSMTAVKLSDDGRILHGSTPDRLYSWDFLTGEIRTNIETRYTGEVKIFKFTSNGEHVFVSDGVRSVSHFDVETGLRLREFVHESTVELVSFALDPGMAYLATFGTVGRPQDGGDFVVTVWDVLSGERLQTLRFPNQIDRIEIPRSVDFSADGTRFLWSTSGHIVVHKVF